MSSPDKILVSVIVPVFNVEQFIEETIQSVLHQTFENIELILVNDGSTDKSVQICLMYATDNSKIKYLEQVNSGVSVARNKGLLVAHGEYIFFMDSDDTIAPDFIASSYRIAKEKAADIVILGKAYTDSYPDTTALPTCAQFLRKSFLDKYPDVRFPEGIQPCEDGLFSHRLLALTDNVALNPTAKYFYRQHEGQNTKQVRNNSFKVLNQIPRWLEILTNFYDKYDLWASHSQHLLLFLEHEPFELRYLGLPLDEDQQYFLFHLIREFEAKHDLLNAKSISAAKLSSPFKAFLKAEHSAEFNSYYTSYYKGYVQKRVFLLFLCKFIPISTYRRKCRLRIRENYPL